MGRNKTTIDSTARIFIRKIKLKFKPSQMILFGSRATSEAWNYSDYDFIVVSNKFKQVHWLDRISQVLQQWDSDRPIDVLPYTDKEFEMKKLSSSVVKEAVKKGIEV